MVTRKSQCCYYARSDVSDDMWGARGGISAIQRGEDVSSSKAKEVDMRCAGQGRYDRDPNNFPKTNVPYGTNESNLLDISGCFNSDEQ